MDLPASLGMSGVPLLAAVALGLLMAFSPCTLATSVVAVMYLAAGTAGRWRFFVSGCLYTLGRLVAYTGLAFLIVWFSLGTRELAVFFENYGERLLAPVLIVAGLWLLGLAGAGRMKWPGAVRRVYERVSGLLAQRSGLSAFLLGIFFSLSFCPFSVVIFFGLLVPLSYRSGDPFLIPAVFAMAGTLPVLLASYVLMTSARHLGRTLTLLQNVNLRLQQVTGAVFLIVGLYFLPRFFGL